MKLWDILFRAIILIIGGGVIAFDVLLYNFCENQKSSLNSIKDKQDVEAEFNSNKFKYQSDQIERVSKGLDDAEQQIKEQKDALDEEKNALLQEIDKRQQLEDENKIIQTSLVDIKAEADAIKQDMKNWQRDYVSVLADLQKKMDSSASETKSIEDNLTALNIPELKENISEVKSDIEKMTHPPDNSVVDVSPTLPADQKTLEQQQPGSQQ